MVLRELIALTSDEDVIEDEVLFPLYICIVFGLVIMAGLMSGLTLGLMSLDMVELEVLKRSGTPDEQRCAKMIMPVIQRQHMLLVTLLLCNAAATEALPIFLDRLANPVAAVLISVTVVLVFGEIIPQAICSRYGLKVGAHSAWFVKALMVVCSPLAWPVGKLLDWMLGTDHGALFRRAQLKALVDLHGCEAGFGGTLSEDEIHVIRGALDLTNKIAAKSMTPIEKVFMLSMDDRLDERTLQAILMSGHSRVPVFRASNRRDIVGLILVKELVLINPSDNVSVSALMLRELPRLSANTPMYDMLKLFETGKSHMAVLIKPHEQQPAAAIKPAATTTSSSWFSAPRVSAQDPATAMGGSSNTRQQRSVFEKYNADMLTTFGERGGVTHGSGMVIDEPVGIITIEDVIEELLQEEILDETDLYVDNLQSTRVNAAAVTGQLPQRLKQVMHAGLFTPRIGRLGCLPKPRALHPPGFSPSALGGAVMPLASARSTGNLLVASLSQGLSTGPLQGASADSSTHSDVPTCYSSAAAFGSFAWLGPSGQGADVSGVGQTAGRSYDVGPFVASGSSLYGPSGGDGGGIVAGIATAGSLGLGLFGVGGDGRRVDEGLGGQDGEAKQPLLGGNGDGDGVGTGSVHGGVGGGVMSGL